MMSLKTRSEEPEIMDDLNCHGEIVDQTLRELEVINRLLGGDHVTMGGIDYLLRADVADDTQRKAIEIADFGCGGGDLAEKIVKWGKRKGYELRVTGIDANPHIIGFARRNNPEISFITQDVFQNKTRYDIITATLFVHHFNDDQLVTLFKSMKEYSRMGVVINDIHRHALSYHSIKLLTKLFSKSAMVKFDAPLSVRRAFKKNELIDILARAGIKDYQIRWKWAFRYQIVILA